MCQGIESPSLCYPDSFKSCFACCPPIRPTGYEHIQYRSSVQRMLRENTELFDRNSEAIAPITGYSCWALGYLEPSYSLIGCLLHPARNGGRDMRFRVDYGHKCAREQCLEAQAFEQLSEKAKEFWLALTRGLDSFQYSSRRHNPLFRLLGWARPLLESIWARERGRTPKLAELQSRYPFLSVRLAPRACSYLVLLAVEMRGGGTISKKGLVELIYKVAEELRQNFSPLANAIARNSPYTHQLGLDQYLLDFLRLGLGLKKVELGVAREIENRARELVDIFGRSAL